MPHPIDSFLNAFNQYATVVEKDLAPDKLPAWMNQCRLFFFRSANLTKNLGEISADLDSALLDFKSKNVSFTEFLSKISDALDYACRARANAFLKHHMHLPEDRTFEKGRFEEHVIKGLEALKRVPLLDAINTPVIEELIKKASCPHLTDNKLSPLKAELKRQEGIQLQVEG